MPEVVLATFNSHAGMRPRQMSVPYVWSPGRMVGAAGPYDLVEAIGRIDADVVVVQEAFRPDEGVSALDRAATELGYEVQEVSFGRATTEPWPRISLNGDATGQVGLAVLSRLPVRRRAELPIRRVFADPAPARQALHLELDVDGAPVDVVGLHLTSRLPHGPVAQIRHLRPQLPVTTRRAVVAGDFNLWGPPVAWLLEGWRRAVRSRTWPAHRPHSQIDHVLVRDGVQVLAAEVLDDLGSDHRPVRVRLGL